jgi:ABC-type transport system substrate-binding protein
MATRLGSAASSKTAAAATPGGRIGKSAANQFPRGGWCPRRTLIAALLTVACAVALGACGSGSSGSGSSAGTTADSGGEAAQGGSITIASLTPPLSLDPAKNSNTVESQYFMDLAYEPLIRLEPDGSLGAGLAASWKYLGGGQQTFELTLRPDAKFSDGSPVTAQAVVNSLDYVRKANGPVGVYINQIKSAEAAGKDTVRLHLAQPDPTIALVLTQRFLIGDIIGPKAIADPESLGTTTDGAGQYVLDTKQTVSGDHYTFVPNPHYFEPAAVHFDKFTISVIENPQTALAALQSGQVSYMSGNPTLAPAAESAGVNVVSTVSAWYGAFLFDRDGEVTPALGSQQVRQALNYATDREGITQALFGEYGKPSAEPSVPGYEGEGYVPALEGEYPYDPDKAKEMLAEAGYPNGFSVTMGASNAFGNGVGMAQALASDWAKIGVKVDIKQFKDIDAIVGPWAGRELPTVTGYYDAQPMFIFAGQALAKEAGLFNPWESVDPQLTKLIDAAYAAAPGQQADAWSAVTERVVDLGWFVPVTAGAAVYFGAEDLQGLEVSPVSFAPNPTRFHF